jgi:hypothetical protein
MSEQCPTCGCLMLYRRYLRNNFNGGSPCHDKWHDTPSQQSAMYLGVDMAQGEPQTVLYVMKDVPPQIDSICGVRDGAVVKVEWKSAQPCPAKIYVRTTGGDSHHGFGQYEPLPVTAYTGDNPFDESPPLPPGATRHAAISDRCLALDSAADYMIGMRRG